MDLARITNAQQWGKGAEMPENNATAVDSVEASAAVDSVADVEQNPPAGGSDPKTYTADELDARIKARIDKQNAKHALDMQQLQEQLQELTKRTEQAESERDALKREQERNAWLNAASVETGIDASLLRGNTQEEIIEHARAIRAAFNAPVVRDTGEHKSVSPTKESILAIKNEKERLAAIRENAELFTN